jgi:hypothetical protein
MNSVVRTIRENLLIMRDAVSMAKQFQQQELVDKYESKLDQHFEKAYRTYKLLN